MRTAFGVLLSMVGLALVVVAGLAGAASAAPAFEVSASDSPASFPIGQDGEIRALVRNVGDVTMPDGSVTVTATLPPGLRATGVDAGRVFGSPVYGCSISPDGHVVTCTGPSTFYAAGIPPGHDACTGTGFESVPCRFVIDVEVDDNAAAGSVTTEIQACGGGAPSCMSASEQTGLHEPRPLAADYGAAAINGHPDAMQNAPAIPGNYAFWAGACDRSMAPGFGADLASFGNGTGFGTRSATVLAGAGKGVFPRVSPPINAQVPAPAPDLPEHCLDWGTHTLYQYRSLQGGAIWQELPYDTGEPYFDAGGGTFGQAGPVGNYAPKWRLPAQTQAGAHPDGTTMLAWSRNKGDGISGVGAGQVDGSVDNVYVDLPPGFVGNPQAVPYCTGEQFAEKPLKCSPESQVGVLRLDLQGDCVGTPCNLPGTYDTTYPVYNLEPRKGRVAELGFAYAADFASVRLVARARTNGDFGVTAFVGQIPSALVPIAQQITLWGVPWAEENDQWRTKLGHFEGPVGCSTTAGFSIRADEVIPPTGLLAGSCQATYDSEWGPIRPFFSAQTECDPGSVTVTLRTDAYQHPGAFTVEGDPDPADPDWKTYTSDSPPVTGCEKLGFDPAASFDPTSTNADAPSGLDVDIRVPQNNDPPAGVATDPSNADGAPAHWKSDAGLATAQLDKTVVTLPEGLSVNPSAATGLEGCSDAQMGVTAVANPYRFDNSEPSCPDGSKIGTVEATTPLLAGSPNLTGEMILGSPKSTDPQSGQMFRLFLVLRNKDRGLLAKVHGTSTADPATGQLTATFDNNPRVPVENIEVHLKGGERGLLAMPRSCGQKTTGSQFTPWTAAHNGGGPVRDLADSFTVGGCSEAFAPSLAAGMDSQAARGSGTFSFKFARSQGQQYLRGLTANLPQGLLASVRGVPLCSNAQANVGACPAGSKIGIVDAKAGAGDPFVLERKGEVFLTERYKGGPYGLAVKIRPIAGPFRGAMELSPIVVRQSIRVDRTTAQVTAVSDPFPLVHHGVPLRVREVTVLVNRAKFMLNPSDCAAKQIAATLGSDKGKSASRSNRFQAAGCLRLAFKPSLSLQLTGRKQIRTGKHPGVKAVVKQAGVPEAGIKRAEVRLPKSLALDPDNAQALCEYEDGIRPDLENHCPKGSIIGRARAVSPLLNDPLVGDVYFVKNVKRSSTGNLIRTLPMLIVALRGEIAVNLKGASDAKGGKLVNVFDEVPDAPISQFNLNVRGGSNGILAVTRTRRAKINLCVAGRQIAEADMDGQNGRRHDFNVAMRKPCPRKVKVVCKTKKQKAGKACKAKAKRAKGGNRR
jgi:hypothetical protein